MPSRRAPPDGEPRLEADEASRAGRDAERHRRPAHRVSAEIAAAFEWEAAPNITPLRSLPRAG